MRPPLVGTLLISSPLPEGPEGPEGSVAPLPEGPEGNGVSGTGGEPSSGFPVSMQSETIAVLYL
jgi:hypothetical protein